MSQVDDLPAAPDDPTPAQMIATLEQTHACAQELLQAEVVSLSAQLARRFEEIAALTRLLAQREDAQHRRRLLERDLARARGVPRAGWAGRLIARRSLPLMLRQRLALRRSTLFDPTWYVRHVPDLGETDPYAHYIHTGAYDGADPGPEFSTIAYYHANPDVVAAGWPALVHYELRGRAQGRPLVPDGDDRPAGAER